MYFDSNYYTKRIYSCGFNKSRVYENSEWSRLPEQSRLNPLTRLGK
jgi:hypothetical protein